MHFLSYKLFAYPLTLRPVRLQVEMRAQIEKKLETKEKSMKELAKKAREENAGLRSARQGQAVAACQARRNSGRALHLFLGVQRSHGGSNYSHIL